MSFVFGIVCPRLLGWQGAVPAIRQTLTKRPTSLDRNAEPLYGVLEVEPL